MITKNDPEFQNIIDDLLKCKVVHAVVPRNKKEFEDGHDNIADYFGESQGGRNALDATKLKLIAEGCWWLEFSNRDQIIFWVDSLGI